MRFASGLRTACAVLWLICCPYAWADETISICFNYGCVAEQNATFTEAQLKQVERQLAPAKSAAEERDAISKSIGTLYYWAGKQTPIYADRGGNMADNGVRGGMDCIDHSTTTTRFLKMLDRRHLLRFHKVLEPARRTRFFIFEHYSAQIEEKDPPWLPSVKIEHQPETPDEAQRKLFVVDSWFVDNGKPAVVLPLDDWTDGAGPDVEPD